MTEETVRAELEKLEQLSVAPGFHDNERLGILAYIQALRWVLGDTNERPSKYIF